MGTAAGSRHAKTAEPGRFVLARVAKATIVTAIGFACSLGIAFGAIQQMPQIVPGLKEVAAKASAAADKAVEASKAKAKPTKQSSKPLPAQKRENRAEDGVGIYQDARSGADWSDDS